MRAARASCVSVPIGDDAEDDAESSTLAVHERISAFIIRRTETSVELLISSHAKTLKSHRKRWILVPPWFAARNQFSPSARDPHAQETPTHRELYTYNNTLITTVYDTLFIKHTYGYRETALRALAATPPGPESTPEEVRTVSPLADSGRSRASPRAGLPLPAGEW